LFRWARRDDAAEHIAKATREAAVNKMFKGGTPSRSESPPAKKLATHHFRRAMAQLFGIVGFLLIIAGLMAALLGMFYTGA
jgi:di/tripeptidase